MRKYLILCLFLSFNSFACLNEFDSHHLNRLSEAEEKKYAIEINHAVQLILEKKYKEAITVLLELEKKYPDRYETATNLGTAYELVGQIDDALVWIQKGITLNPNSHEGTEWLHYKILQAKENIARNPNYLQDNPIFDISTVDALDSIKALDYQLKERTKLVQPPDDIVADLYFLQGLLYEQQEDEVMMHKSFNSSIKYGDLRKAQMNAIKAKGKEKIDLKPVIIQ